MRMYEKYNYWLISWFLSEVFAQWGIMIIFIFIELYGIFLTKRVSPVFTLIIPVAYFFYCGYYQHSIRAITTGIWSTILTPQGIYGKRFWEKLLLFLPYRLLARWEEIERVEYHKETTDPDMGYIRIVKNSRKKFDIVFFRVLPFHLGTYSPDKFEKGSNKGMVAEMVGIIAWKVGISKLVNFPEREEFTSIGKRKYILAMDTILQVVSEIKKGSSFTKIDKEYEKSEEKGIIKKRIFLWELDAMKNPYRYKDS